MNVLSTQMRMLESYSQFEWKSWALLCGQKLEDNWQQYRNVPMLLADPTALLIKFVLLSSLNLDQGGLKVGI